MIKEFWKYHPSDLYQTLNTSANGLSSSDAALRLAKSSAKIKKISPLLSDLKLLIVQFSNPLMLLLIGAVLISVVIGEFSDIWMILLVILSAGILGFVQERNAGRTVEKLRKLLAVRSTVLRDGVPAVVETGMIVEGDIIMLDAGDIIPADCLLIESNELHVNEAGLTGESFPVRKIMEISPEKTPLAERLNALWEGTNVVSGTAKGLAINTGLNTVFGNIIRSANEKPETSFEKGIKDFGYFLLRITMILALMILVMTLLNGRSIMESALFALALAVGMAPELLPAITTIAMSAGAKRLLDKKVIVKKLSSIQNLGEVNLLCTDKTGTITKGEISLHDAVDVNGNSNEYTGFLGYINARLQSGYDNPIDTSLKECSQFSEKPIPVKTGEIPYDFIRKRLTVAVHYGESQLVICKGAYKEILEICSHISIDDQIVELDDVWSEKCDLMSASFGKNGFRVIAVCRKEVPLSVTTDKSMETGMIFSGFLLLNDPVKHDINQTLGQLNALNVSVKIITGDNRNVAASVALQLGISEPLILTGADLTKISSEALLKKVISTHIFAEVEPFQKERIIRALRHTFTVAYLGDGINDVGALKAADIGISVENAVDVAKEAADIVLTEKDLSVLCEGIREGRKTFANTIKYIYISTGSTFGNMLSVAAASMFLPFLPMLPAQILLTNLISDFPYLMIASDYVDDSVYSKAGKWNIHVINRYMLIFGIHSSFFDLLTFLTLYFVFKSGEAEFQTGWFLVSVLTELVILFIIRSRKSMFSGKPHPGLLWTSIGAIVFTLLLPFIPLAAIVGLVRLPINIFIAMCMILVTYMITAEYLKFWFYKKFEA